MSIAGSAYTSNQDNSVSLRQTFIKQTFPADTVKRGLEKISLRLQRIQNAATMSSNLIGLGSENGVSEPVLTVWKAAGNGATHEIVIPVHVTAGSTVTATGRLNVGASQILGIPMRMTVEDPTATDTFNSDFTITSATDGSTTFTATGTATVDWAYIKFRIRINGAFTAQGDPQITTEFGTISLTTTQQLGNTATVKVALFEDDRPLIVSDGKLAYEIATAMTVYDFVFSGTIVLNPNTTLSAIVFIDGDTSDWSDTLTTIKVSIDATASPYADGYAEYYTAGAWSYTPTGIAGTYDQTTTDMYFAMFYQDSLPTTLFDLIEWTEDCNAQASKILNILTVLDSVQESIYNRLNHVIQVEQNTEPVMESFEYQWGSSPVPSNALLLWQNTQENEFGGQFVYNPNKEVIEPNQNAFVRGYPQKIDFIQTSGVAFTAPAIGSGNFASWVSGAFVARFVVTEPTQLSIKFVPQFVDSVALASVNFDYLIVPFGTTPLTTHLAAVAEYGLAAGDGIIQIPFRTQAAAVTDGILIDWLHPTVLSAGAYSIYINFWLRSGTNNSWILGYDPQIGASSTNASNYPIILLEGKTKWQVQ